ncbi:MAG: 2-oxo acid dehydrogenase subunit E2 [Methanimicrococcus sp.]|nr:2-oxo acid dehydrogenase subunit E2 [Methanimicrococcus sp.]
MKRIGDRRVRVRNVDGTHKVLAALSPHRCDADVYINEKMDVTNLVRYVTEKKETDPEFTYFHAFCACMGKLFYERPLLNRFVLNRKFYDHGDVTLGFVAKVSFEDDSKETLSIVTIDPDDNIDTIKEKVLAKVKSVRSSMENKTDGVVNLLEKMPQFLVNFVIWLLQVLDNYNLIPTAVVSDDIYHSSAIISNLGSIQCGAIYHHLVQYGTSSLLITFGPIKKEAVVNEDGQIEIKDMVEIGVTCDDRIADGFYFAKSILSAKHIFNNPQILESPMKEKINYENK